MGVAWRDLLSSRLRGRIVVVALGDRAAGDDGAGPSLLELLPRSGEFVLLDCGTYPQNFLGPIAAASPDVVMLVDAAELGMQPGELRILDKDEVTDWAQGTHGIPLDLLMAQIEAMTGADVFLLGIQVTGHGRGKPMHPSVEEAVKELASFLADHCRCLDQRVTR